jgi:cytochrome P450
VSKTGAGGKDGKKRKRLRRNPYAFLAFLVGEHSCIGNKFALMEMSAILAAVVPRIDFTAVVDAPCRPKLFITMRPFPSLQLDLRRAA